MKKIVVCWLFSACAIFFTGFAHSTSLFNTLMDGQHLLMIRHADAPGFSDPSGFKLGECATQRNLGERGRKQAQALGMWLKREGIHSAVVLSSEWCRCEETAVLMNVGAVSTVPELGSFFQNMHDSGSQTQALKKLLARRLNEATSRKPMILVTHQVNISAFAGTSIGQGDVLLVKVGATGDVISVRPLSVPFAD